MRSDFENFRPEFSISVRLFRMLDNFSNSGRLFQLRDNFRQSGPEIVNFRLAFEKVGRKS